MQDTQERVNMSASCTSCGAVNWKIVEIFTTRLRTKERVRTGHEIRCATCGKKAIQSVQKIVRQSEEFKQVITQEN
jgi:DNA-directed RNA polymerase subunit N (RpoN/RPB10)